MPVLDISCKWSHIIFGGLPHFSLGPCTFNISSSTCSLPPAFHMFESCPSLKPNQTKYNYPSASHLILASARSVSFPAKLFKRNVSGSSHSHLPLLLKPLPAVLCRGHQQLVLAKFNGLLTPTPPSTLRSSIASSRKPSVTPYTCIRPSHLGSIDIWGWIIL